jgi:hypothetical protein
MFNFFKSLNISTLLQVELPSLIASDLIAERFYKFGSFTLEASAFVFTWFLLSFFCNKIENAIKKK